MYPALYRMERRGGIEAEWGTSELGRSPMNSISMWRCGPVSSLPEA